MPPLFIVSKMKIPVLVLAVYTTHEPTDNFLSPNKFRHMNLSAMEGRVFVIDFT